jgi:hypothetical protein
MKPDGSMQGAARHTLIILLRSCELQRNTLWNEPHTCKILLSRMKN